jgi:hypothetical protein
LLFLTLFYTEALRTPLPNGNKLTTPEFVRRFFAQNGPETNFILGLQLICVVNLPKRQAVAAVTDL